MFDLTLDRIAVCEVWYLLESDYNVSGVLQERKSNQRRKMSTGYQLHRMGFKSSPMLSFDTLDTDQQEYYLYLVESLGLPAYEQD